MPNHSLNDTHIGSVSIYLDSSKATIVQNGENNSNCVFNLDNVIQCPPDTHMLLGLTACQIPVTFYNITSNNNELTIQGSVNGTTNIVIPPQNYNTETLATEINSQLQAAGNNITCSFNSSSYKFKFTSLTQTLQIQNTTMNKELGIPPFTPFFPSNNFTCPNMCNLSGTQSIYVMVNNLSIQSLDSRAKGDLNGVLSKVDVCCAFGDYIEFQQTENQFYLITDRTISHFNVSLTDDNLELLEMNGIDWSISITCHFSKKRLPVVLNDFLLNEDNPRENSVKEKNLLKDLDKNDKNTIKKTKTKTKKSKK